MLPIITYVCMLILLIKKINTITRVSQNCHSVPSGQGIIRCRNDSLGKHCTAGETKKNIVDVVVTGNQKKSAFLKHKSIFGICFYKIWRRIIAHACNKIERGNLQKESFPKNRLYLGNKLEIVNNAQELKKSYISSSRNKIYFAHQ